MNIKKLLLDWGYPQYRYNQLLQSVFNDRIGEFKKMSLLPIKLRE